MTVLVTGGAGFIGRSVTRRLMERGETPVVMAHRWQGRNGLESVLPAGSVDGCIHLGWYADTRDCLTNVAENRRSLQDSLDLVEFLSVRRCRSLVVAGTAAEYAISDREVTENAPVAPVSVYAAAKVSFHQFLRSSLAPTGMAVSWGRIFNVTGPGEDPHRLLPHVARSVLAERAVSLTSGTQVRDFLHVDDVADGLVQALYAARPGSYNVSSGRGASLREILTELAQALGDPRLLKFGDRARGEYDPDMRVGCNAALRGLGWRPRHNLTETLNSVADYWKAADSRTEESKH